MIPQGFQEHVFPGRETGKKRETYQETQGFSCILSGFQGVSGFQRETYQVNPGFSPCILSGFQGDIRFPTGKPGEKPRSYQRSREKSDCPQKRREKTDLIRVHFGQLMRARGPHLRIIVLFKNK